MAIRIIDEDGPDIFLTAEEHARLMDEYRSAFMFYAGTPPSFEAWVRAARTGGTTITGDGTNVTFIR